jgi:hypothetical protein
MSVWGLSVRPHVTMRELLNGFSWNLILGRSTDNCLHVQNSFNRTKIKDTLHECIQSVKKGVTGFKGYTRSVHLNGQNVTVNICPETSGC